MGHVLYSPTVWTMVWQSRNKTQSIIGDEGSIGSPILPRRENRKPYSASSHPHPEGSDSDFWGFGTFSVLSHNILASGVSCKAENAFGHNALTRRIDPHTAETPITSKVRLSAFHFCIFQPCPTASPAKCKFPVLCISANPSSEKSGTPPDRSPMTCYIESFEYQPSFMETTFHFSKVCSETLSGCLFSYYL